MIRLAAGVAAAKAVGTLARTAGRGGGTSLPGKVLTRVEPHAIGRLAQPPGPRQRRDLRHQRQDHDRGDGRLDPRAHRRPARPQPRGREHGGRDRERAGQRLAQGRARADRRLRPLRGRRVLARRRSSRSSSRARCCSATSSATSSTATASWRRSPTAGRVIARSSRDGLVLNADDPLVADLGRHAPDPAYFGVDDDSLALPELQHASRLQALPPLRPRLHLRGGLPRPPRPLPLPELRPGAPAADGRRHRRRAARHPQRRVHAARPARRAPAPRPLQRLQRARRGRADAQPRRRARRRRRRPAGRRARVRPRRDARPRRPADVASCWSRTRPARTRCCGRSRSRTDELDLLGVLNDRIADGRDVSWVWDADWELLVGRVRRFTAPARAPPSSRCG